MGLVVALSCPQCGGTIECDEADHFLRCPYCNACSFLTSRDIFRYVLPIKKDYASCVYIPYLRFRGAVYLCKGLQVDYRVIDLNSLAVPLNILPATLGLRPQAMKMRFVDPEQAGIFLKCVMNVTGLLEKTGNFFAPAAGERFFHRAYIGETMSLIYLPLAICEDRIIDAVTDRQIAMLPTGSDLFTPFLDRGCWKPEFLAALCPACGSDLAGEKDSVIMLCGNCRSAWEASSGQWVQVESLVWPAEPQPPDLYLPFWAMTIQATGLEINSYADFLRLSNQPRVVRKEFEQQKMQIWAPAFKITPKIFLRLASQLTIGQPDLTAGVAGIPPGKVYPVTLPGSEARQCPKIILANSAMNKKDVLPQLPDAQFDIGKPVLVYLPFEEHSHELFEKKLGLQINRQSLVYGRLL